MLSNISWKVKVLKQRSIKGTTMDGQRCIGPHVMDMIQSLNIYSSTVPMEIS